MKILHIGNLGNLGFNLVKALRKHNVEADLLFRKNEIPTMNPWYEYPELKKKKNWPSWLIEWKKHSPFSIVGLIPLIFKYDIIQGSSTVPIFLSFLPKPYIAYSTGDDLRTLALENTIEGRLMRRGYEKAKVVFFSNPDELDAIEKIGIKNKCVFLPRIVNLSKYKPKKPTKKHKKFVVFCPGRVNIKEKGVDKLVRGFANFCTSYPNAVLVMVRWGEDLNKIKKIVDNLNIKKNVKFIKPLNKRQLIKKYRDVDIVADQFGVGSYGIAAIEAMALEKPVIVYLNKKRFKECLGRMPPVLNAKNESEIAKSLIWCYKNRNKLYSIGKKARMFVLRYHNEDRIVRKMMEVYKCIK